MADQTTAYLHALTAGFDPAMYVEVRFRRRGGMRQLFFTIEHTPDAARVIAGLASRTDVYVGVLPRTLAAGDRAAIAHATVAWADCDTIGAVTNLADFRPAPSIVVASGSPSARHAYWLLAHPVSTDRVEQLNRRIAAALGSDVHSTDAARVLRPPGTLNHKHEPPRPVELQQLSDRRVDPQVLVEHLPHVVPGRSHSRAVGGVRAADALLGIEPPRYVAALLGTPVGRGRKVRCPFHEDRTPSLHVYDDPDRGWHCYGCGRGGSIYDFAAHLWNLETRGTDFLTLRARLRERLHV